MIIFFLCLQLITGDFDGDGHPETLRRQVLPNGLLALIPDKPGLDIFFVERSLRARGFLYLRNEGDLNGDGAHEFSFVPDAADFSNVNTCFIISLKNGKWTVGAAFDVLETELKIPLVNKERNGRISIWRYDPAAGEMELQTLTPSLWKQ